ncbi:MAG TPA: GAF domain-containing protein, partial [Polyangiales bacterium]|nr:GAF domain-containing protein [Polyangiales bacterium]
MTRDDAGPPVCSVVGQSGSGVSRLVQELIWRAQLKLRVLRLQPGRADLLSELLGPAYRSTPPLHALQGLLSALPLLTERTEPLLLAIEDHERLEPAQRELVISLLRALPRGGRVVALISGQGVPAGLTTRELTCDPLALSELAEWASPLVAERKLPALLEASGGLPSRVEWLLQRASGSKPADFRQEQDVAGTRRRLQSLPETAKSSLAMLFAAGGEQASEAEPLESSALDELVALALVKREGARYRIAAPIAHALPLAGLEQELAAAHRALITQLSAEPARADARHSARLIHHLCLAGERPKAETLVLEQQQALRDAAPLLWPQLSALADATRNARVLLVLSRVLLEGKQPRRALSLAIRAARLQPELYESSLLLVADGLIRLGRPARAERLLARATAAAGARTSSALLDRLARAMLAGGNYANARLVAERARASAITTEERARASEAYGIALSYSSDLLAAQRALEEAVSAWGTDAAPRERYRAQSVSAIVAFRAGDLSSALSLGQSALDLAEEQDLDEVLPMALLNLGTAEQQCGQWGKALEHYERGLEFARAIGRIDTQLTLEFNLANLLVEIGAFERAEEILSGLGERLARQPLKHVQSSVCLLRAEMHLLRGDWDAAEAPLAEAERHLGAGAPARERLEVGLRLVELALGRGHDAEAARRLEALESIREPARDLAFSLALARARLLVERKDALALAQLEALAAQAKSSGALAMEALVATELAIAAESLLSPEEAARRSERARRLWDRVGLDLPSALGAAYWRHPRRARSSERSRAVAAPPGAPEALALRRLLSLVRRLNSPHSLDSVLDFTTSAAVELTAAERGFLLLLDEDGSHRSLQIRRASEPMSANEHGPSQSIARRALAREEAVLTADALADPRFVGQGSVHALQLKSVLCVPILAPGGPLGVVYVDSRVQRNRFTPADRELLAAFADHVAIAIGNARRVSALEQRTKALEQQ